MNMGAHVEHVRVGHDHPDSDTTGFNLENGWCKLCAAVMRLGQMAYWTATKGPICEECARKLSADVYVPEWRLEEPYDA